MRKQLDIVIDQCRIEAVILEQKKQVILNIDVEKNPKQMLWIGKKVGDTYKLQGINITYRIEKIEESLSEEKEKEDHERRKAEQEKQKETVSTPSAKKRKSIDELFGEDYNAAHLKRVPILTYQQVEDQFGIRISGFGRGINPTEKTVVLISSIGKSGGAFVYHDKWTLDGDYIYSGEGKNGDQKMSNGNLAIKTAAQDGKKIHLFVKFSPQEYYYQGIFELVKYTYEDDKDENGDIRKEYKFRLRKVK